MARQPTQGKACDVLLTVYWHLRSASVIRARYGATVWGNAKTREDVEELVTGVVGDGASLPGGATAFTPIPNDADEDETAYWFPHWRALAVGDILVNTPAGLRVWWEQKTEPLRLEYHERVRPALTRLLELPIEIILVTHGLPIAHAGRAALRKALEAPTWQRSEPA